MSQDHNTTEPLEDAKEAPKDTAQANQPEQQTQESAQQSPKDDGGASFGGLFSRFGDARKGLGDRLAPSAKRNLNALLDAVEDFEERGGLSNLVDFDLPPLPGADYDSKSLRQYYANLETPYGADLDTVKKNYRRLMRKYHPDRHSGDPQREELATELSQELTRAYRVVSEHLRRSQR